MHVLLNWLAQGTALTIAVALGVRLHRTMNAATRERIWWIALIAVVLMPVAFILKDVAAVSRTSAPSSAAPADVLISVQAQWNGWVLPLLAVWAAWTTLGLVRVGLALVSLQRTKRLAAPFPRDAEARLRVWTAMRHHARPATLVVSPRVHRAAVLGLGRPLIAVSPDALAQLTSEELDQIVLHEYAHIQRLDDVAIVAQRIITAFAGLHPAVWWLDRALTIDREIACDDWVVTYTGARRRYAQCLVKLAESGAPGRWSGAPGVLLSPSQLTLRVTALVDPRHRPTIAPSSSTLRVALPAVAVLAAACVSAPLAGVAPDRRLPTAERLLMGAAAPPVAAPVVTPTAPRTSAVGRRRREGSESTPAPVEEVAVAVGVEPLPATVLAQLDFGVAPAPRVSQAPPVRESPWRAVADAGLTVGDRSTDAALRTAGFFSRVGRSFANAF